jgi:hypothetical protein
VWKVGNAAWRHRGLRNAGDRPCDVCANEAQWSVLAYSLPARPAHVYITTEALRRSAELSMHKLVRTVLSKLHILDPVSEEKKLSSPPSTPTTATFSSSSTRSVEPVPDDSIATTQAKTPTARSHQEASSTQKLDCMSWHRFPFAWPDVDHHLRWSTVDC